MRSILVISNEAKDIASLFKALTIPEGRQDIRKKEISIGTDLVNLLKYDIALLDLDTEQWKQRISELRNFMPVIAFSTPDIKKAVEAIKLGASDYLEKPLSTGQIVEIVKKYKKKILNTESGFDEAIGTSTLMQEVFGVIKKAAVSESNVLITGESGTGKELVARAIHRWSPRKENSFVIINCGAIPDTLLESELFGFEKGAFTGANYTKKGLLEFADGGTVFFDEIGDVSPLFQVKILRVLQEGEVLRIGGSKHIKVNLRIISATNRDLDTARRRGLFREDLFYRLNVIHIHLPPLRDRKEDIPALVRHFLEKHSIKRKDMLIKDISDEAMSILLNYDYPGNIRELENIIEHAISFAGGPSIIPANLPASLLKTPSQKINPSPRLKEALKSVEKELIWSALQRTGGNISKAAIELGVHRQHLQRKLKSLKLET